MNLLLILLLAAHLLAMNLASAGPLVAVAMARRQALVDDAARRLLPASLTALLLGCLVGGALLLRPAAGVAAALARFPPRAYWFAAAELLFSAGCIVALQLLWTRCRRRRWGQSLLALLALAGASNLLYHFPPLMGVFGKLIVNSRWTDAATLHRPELLAAMQQTEIVALTVHFLLASLTVGCLAGIVAVGRQLRRTIDPPPAVDETASALQTARRLARCALAITFVQFLSGVWLLTAVEGPARDAMLGGRLEPTLYLGAGLFAAVKLAERIAAAAFEDPREATRSATFWLCTTVALMSGVLWTSRPAEEMLPRNGKTSRPGEPAATSVVAIH